ncbi:HD domain-containing protein [Mitsuaria sp. TWR114]|jgi:predicted HD phosphohydrolase|uniref:HD domain-containing protein n=1 Tax=unclassified Roseateles TaxID=2626991 RepID=UPI0008F1C895|nr:MULTISPECIES: HD domain-containing protein [unclassified Roseateles]MBB3283451.1 putative HD phosphohydrolase [Mitsuaria sp. BK037]MBB3295492.1 putative HD phosphohydrolase [Mitsuaria sp. BK041]MBB3364708.1 putative HD phosphohydrolase [Mitsuaria sp. BK045]TXD85653.1 HD domain-containing protein [Mitsuaria sp. TWR114]SFR92266.1 Predicted HD phosphohydrolase [Mitsuaria sp. PDC51]
MDLIAKVEAVFHRRGHLQYGDERREPVTALEHALQCAQLAEWAHAEHSLVAAALLHDVGQLMDGGSTAPLRDDQHELTALPLLRAGGLGPDVLEPIRLHVDAKRYLVSTDPAYGPGLSEASRHSLALQGGPMNAEERLRFMTQRHASAALQLRRWDDLAKRPGMRTPPLGYYLALLEELLRDSHAPERLRIA